VFPAVRSIATTSKAASASLSEVHGSVVTAHGSWFKRLLAFSGPAYLVSVGYMDPGNWATDLAGGAQFGYRLLWVLVLSNILAILLQTLSARLGIAAGRDLAQACRETYSRPVNVALWVLCEIAIAACDLAEVLGAAIALNLLFHLPLLAGVLLMAADTLLLLWLQRYGIRVLEAVVLVLILTIGASFGLELLLARPDAAGVLSGLVPRIDSKTLYLAIAILGATVMPHNLYLHSALVQTRRIGNTLAEKRMACRFNLIDSAVALNLAMLVNAAILVVSAAVFFRHGKVVTEIQQAHELLSPLLGSTIASGVFAIALLCSGQSSTLTGTMAGQIVMEGFLDLRVRPWMRRLATRMMAVIPAALVIGISGPQATYQLIILSQVVLSAQLPFAVIPLIHLTSDRARMGELVNKAWLKVVSWLAAIFIVVLNAWLLVQSLDELTKSPGTLSRWVWAVATPVSGALALLLLWITVQPLFRQGQLRRGAALAARNASQPLLPPPVYRRIMVTLDHSARDPLAVSHAAALATAHGAELFLFHVEEGVTSQVYGPLSSTAEVQSGEDYLQSVVERLHDQSISVQTAVSHSSNPASAIVRYAREISPDILVMGAHGHRRLKDLILGNTIDPVRHRLSIPVLVVSEPNQSRRIG
jgi:manganese transport protein